MVMFRSFNEEQDAAEIELANGETILVPRNFVPKDAKPGTDIQVKAQRTSTPQPRRPAAAGGRAQQAYRAFLDMGWGPTAAAGIVGNLMQESGTQLNATAVGDRGTAFGIGQWRGKRYAQLRSFAKQQGTDWRDFNTQLAFTNWELRNTERAAGQRLLAAETVEDATFAMAGFERPQGWKGFSGDPSKIHGWGNRLKFAKTVMGGGGGAPSEDGTPFAGMREISPSALDAGDGRTATFDGGDDSIRSRLRTLVSGRRSNAGAVKKRSRGEVISDVIGAVGEGLAAGGNDRIDIPENPFGTPGQFGSMSNQMAQSGPLPGLPGLGPLQRLKDFF